MVVRLAYRGHLGWSGVVLGFVLLALVASYLTLAPRYAAWRAARIDRAADDAIAAFDRHDDPSSSRAPSPARRRVAPAR
jgi:hypothetical protein